MCEINYDDEETVNLNQNFGGNGSTVAKLLCNDLKIRLKKVYIYHIKYLSCLSMKAIHKSFKLKMWFLKCVIPLY